MNEFRKALAIGAAVVSGPLLAFAAIGIRDQVTAEAAPDDDFSLKGVFVGSDTGGGFAAYSCVGATEADNCTETATGPGRGGWNGVGYGWGGDYGWGGSSGGHDTNGAPPEPPPEADPTPCVEASPAAFNAQVINNAAKALTLQLADRTLYDLSREWGAIIYSVNGQVYATSLVRGTTDDIDWNKALLEVPDNAYILANIHHHPDISGINDAIPSYADMRTQGKDWRAYDQFLGVNHRGITTDPSVLMYIHTDEPENRGTWVYDRTDRNTRRESCRV